VGTHLDAFDAEQRRKEMGTMLQYFPADQNNNTTSKKNDDDIPSPPSLIIPVVWHDDGYLCGRHDGVFPPRIWCRQSPQCGTVSSVAVCTTMLLRRRKAIIQRIPGRQLMIRSTSRVDRDKDDPSSQAATHYYPSVCTVFPSDIPIIGGP